MRLSLRCSRVDLDQPLPRPKQFRLSGDKLFHAISPCITPFADTVGSCSVLPVGKASKFYFDWSSSPSLFTGPNSATGIEDTSLSLSGHRDFDYGLLCCRLMPSLWNDVYLLLQTLVQTKTLGTERLLSE